MERPYVQRLLQMLLQNVKNKVEERFMFQQVILQGPIELTSNLTLYADAGAKIVFTQDPKEYPVIDTFGKGQIVRHICHRF